MNEPAKSESGAKLLTRDQVTSAISTLMGKLTSQATVQQDKIVTELFDLAGQIDSLYAELASLHPHNIKSDQIQTAHDELSAVVQATAEATFLIIAEAERLEKLGKQLPPEQAALVSESVTRIYEACGFQDITGQRITKVVRTLKAIEDKVDALIVAVGGQRPESVIPNGGADTRSGDEALLNGPSMPGQGISQDEIDKLLGF